MSSSTPIVVFAADERYAMPLTVAICATGSAAKPTAPLRIVVLDDGLRPESRAKVEASFARIRSDRIQWIPTPESIRRRLEGLEVGRYYSTTVYLRLFIPELLEAEARRAIYLDCDVLPMADIAWLWRQSLGAKSILAARDLDSVVSSPHGLPTYRELGIPADTPYLNSGVMVLDLDRWRADGHTRRMLDYARAHRDQLLWYDQDAINAVLWRDWQALPPAWNDQLADLASDPRIVHFSGRHKPWLPGCTNPWAPRYLAVLRETAWWPGFEQLRRAS